VSARSKARKAALDFLYESDIRNRPAMEILQSRVTELEYPVREFTRELVNGVSENRERIDEIIAMRAKGWDLDRMPVLDRNILRLGTFEILWSESVPIGVAVDEAVELAKTLSTEDSPNYVNGVLTAVAEIKGEIAL
jgi:transcription antitermination protein NusB